MRIGLLLLISLLALAAGCSKSLHSRWLREFELNAQNFDTDAMQMVSADSKLLLPDGTRGLNFRYRPPIDPAFLARLAIPEESVEQLQKQIEAIKDEKINIVGGLRESTTWWTPEKGVLIIDRQCRQADNDYLRVILTREERGVVLYVDHAVF